MPAKLAKILLGKKIGMTQIFSEDGQALAVTVLKAGPCVVVQRRERKNDAAAVGVQLGFEEVPEEKRRRKVNKPMAGHFKKTGVAPQKYLREFTLPEGESYALGQQLKADIFAAGEKVNIAGISKGKGFTGAMKRHGFHGGENTHGSMSHRRIGTSGGTDAARTFKGTKKPGHMGAVRKTTKGITVVRVQPEKDLLIVLGSVPGPPGGLVEISQPVGRNS
jgi:large subunit ribosomal protein L3